MSEFLTQRDIATIVMDGTTIFMVLGILFQSTIMRQRGRKDDRLFFMLLVIDAFIALAEIATYLGDGKSFPGARLCNLLGVTVFYMLFGVFALFWLWYTQERFWEGKTRLSAHKGLLMAPILILECLLLINLPCRFIFWVDASNTYHREVLFVPMYLLLLCYIFGGFGLIFRYRRKSGNRSRVPVLLYMLPLVLILVVPFVFGGISMAAVGLACGLVFTHIGSMNEQMAIEAGKDEYDGDR